MRGERAFTLYELLGVLVVIAILTMVAYPSIKKLSNPNKDASVAGEIAQLFNRSKDQARKRNRAYLFSFSNFSKEQPRGTLDIREANNPSCRKSAVDVANLSKSIRRVPFGAETFEDENVGEIQAEDPEIGLLEWEDEEDTVSSQPLLLCISPKGSTWRVVEGVPKPVERVSLLLQHFATAKGPPEGLPRRVDFRFGAGARLRLN